MKIKPTFLYIKQHTDTKMLYFGKTTRNPEKYNGSGKKWLNHIKKYGTNKIDTLWYCLFLDFESLNLFALRFSELNKIANSEFWANLKDENGIDGALPGSIPSNKGKPSPLKGVPGKNKDKKIEPHSITHKERISISLKKLNLKRDFSKRESRKNLKHESVTCPHCQTSGGANIMSRWHFDNCKNKMPM